MKSFIALILLLGFMALGVWLGVFVLFAPGLIEIISQCQTEVSATPLAWAIVKVLFAWPVCVFCVALGAGFSKEIMGSSE